MGIQAEDPQQPRPTCPIYFLARSSDSNLQMFSIFQSIKVLQLLHKSPGRSSYSRHLSHPIPRLAASRGKVEPNLTRKLAHTRCLSDRGKHTASETGSGIEIAGFEATGSHLGLNLHTALVCHCPCFWQWVPAGVRKQYSDVINTSA